MPQKRSPASTTCSLADAGRRRRRRIGKARAEGPAQHEERAEQRSEKADGDGAFHRYQDTTGEPPALQGSLHSGFVRLPRREGRRRDVRPGMRESLRSAGIAAVAFTLGLLVAWGPHPAGAAAAPLQPAVIDLSAVTFGGLPASNPATPNLRSKTLLGGVRSARPPPSRWAPSSSIITPTPTRSR